MDQRQTTSDEEQRTPCHYDFRHHPRCGFWNISYGMVARVQNMATWQLKQLCAMKNGSPIVYADSLPIGLENNVNNKYKHRKELQPECIGQHIDNVFSHETITSHVKLVFTSGLESSVFGLAKMTIEAVCRNRNIPVGHLPFFYGTNAQKIQQALTEEHVATISDILMQFSMQPVQSVESNARTA